MRYRALGKTGLKVSEIGLGAEWLERHSAREVSEVILHCEEAGINILDCWMSEPNVRSNIGAAIKGRRGGILCVCRGIEGEGNDPAHRNEHPQSCGCKDGS